MAKEPVDDFWDFIDQIKKGAVGWKPEEKPSRPRPKVEPVGDEDDLHAEERMERDLLELAKSMEMLAVRIANRMSGTGRSVSKSRRIGMDIRDLLEHYRADCLRRRAHGR